MAGEESTDGRHETRTVFYIGHHDSKRTEVSPELLHQAQDCNVNNTSIHYTITS